RRTQQKGELQTTVQHCEESLVNLASGALPLSLVDDLLGQVAEQAQRERSAAESGFLTSLLSKRDKDLLKTLKSARASDDVVKVASEFLNKDRQKRSSADKVEAWLDLPDVSARRLDELLESGLTKRLEESVELMTRLEDAQRDLENVERSLAAAPKE